MTTTYYVACRVSGGVTGTREALLKRDGKVQQFTTEAEAESCAAALRQTMNGPYAVAYFQYWVVEERES
jgi:hypothetical protein